MICNKCGSKQKVKNGFVNKGNQRYKCLDCGSNYTITKRKYSLEIKIKVIKMYLEGVGIRSIERLEGISNPLIISWIRKVGNIIKDKLVNTEVPSNLKDVEIMEIDELSSYYKKNPKEFGSGLPLIAIGTKLLILK